jgi:hypothetical protein
VAGRSITPQWPPRGGHLAALQDRVERAAKKWEPVFREKAREIQET